MKKILIACLLMVSIQLSGQEMRLIEIETNEILDIGAEHSWKIVTDWASLDKLAPAVVESTEVDGEGLYSTWKIHLKNGASITEKMVSYNEQERTMSYIMTKTGMPIENYFATIKVEPYGISKSMVSFYTSCKTSKENYQNIKETFKNFQITYLGNIEKQKNDE